MFKKSKNLEKSKKISKIQFFSTNKNVKEKFFAKKKNAILSIFQYQEDAISPQLSSPARFKNTKNLKNLKKPFFLDFQYQEDGIQPELSSPVRFRFQGGYPERDGRRTEILLSNFGCISGFMQKLWELHFNVPLLSYRREKVLKSV